MNERKESLVATNDSDTVYPAKGHIVKIKFNNGKELDINKNDIVIFVGPNNAGKSQSLSDIYQLAKNKVPTIVVSDIEVSKEGSLKQLLEATSKKDYNGNYIQYTALNHMVSYGDGHTENYFSKNQYYGEYRNWFVTKGDNVMCPYCISTVLAEVTEQRPKKKKNDTPQIIKDANDAAEHGMSYGEWMASKERSTGSAAMEQAYKKREACP